MILFENNKYKGKKSNNLVKLCVISYYKHIK